MSQSSNDLLADRRFAWARACTAEGDHAAAADLLEQATARVPEWAQGWAALGEARELCGDASGARAAWARAASLDPTGALGSGLNLARLDGRTPDEMPAGYVRALFDDYAPRFDRHLVGKLDYRGPAVLLAALDRLAPERRFRRALDLGCGTGLMGRALAGRVGAIDGVDLSAAMVEQARATGVYASLRADSLEDVLAASAAGAYDLVIAADVFAYLGDLAPVFAAAAPVLAPGGLLAFTAQTLTEGVGYRLGADMRFAHAPDYVDRGLRAAGLRPAGLECASIRRENDVAVPGFVAIASR